MLPSTWAWGEIVCRKVRCYHYATGEVAEVLYQQEPWHWSWEKKDEPLVKQLCCRLDPIRK